MTGELAELGRRQLPVLVLSSDHDGVIPNASFNALCAAVGAVGHVVKGGHSWLLANPASLTEVLDNILLVQVAEHGTKGARRDRR